MADHQLLTVPAVPELQQMLMVKPAHRVSLSVVLRPVMVARVAMAEVQQVLMKGVPEVDSVPMVAMVLPIVRSPMVEKAS